MTRNYMSTERLNDDVKSVEGISYLGDVGLSNASGGFEMTVVARRIECLRFRECGKVLCGKRFLFEMKGKVYQICKIGNIIWKRKHGA